MASSRDERRAAIVKKYNLPEAEIRDQVSIQQLLYRQIERCNQAGSSNEGLNFEGCIDVLFQMVPNSVRAAVVHRVKEYKTSFDKPVYRYNAGTPVGSVEHPVRLPDGSIWSPVMEHTESIDYRSLFNIVMQELEAAKITWRYDNLTMELGKVDMSDVEIPLETQERARLLLEKFVEDDNKTGYNYTYYDLCLRIEEKIPPPTPVFNEANPDFDVDGTEEVTDEEEEAGEKDEQA